MLPTAHLLAFAVTGFVLVAVPGPSVLLVVSRSLAPGRRAGLATVLGNGLGVPAQVIAVALAVRSMMQRSTAAFTGAPTDRGGLPRVPGRAGHPRPALGLGARVALTGRPSA